MSDKGQSQRFAEAAAAIDADPGEVAFCDKLTLIARQKPAPEPKRAATPRTPTMAK
jgi:hypothetical protein